MIFGKDDSSSSSEEENADGEDLFGKQTGGMIMMPQGKFILTTLLFLF